VDASRKRSWLGTPSDASTAAHHSCAGHKRIRNRMAVLSNFDRTVVPLAAARVIPVVHRDERLRAEGGRVYATDAPPFHTSPPSQSSFSFATYLSAHPCRGKSPPAPPIASHDANVMRARGPVTASSAPGLRTMSESWASLRRPSSVATGRVVLRRSQSFRVLSCRDATPLPPPPLHVHTSALVGLFTSSKFTSSHCDAK